MGRYSLMSMSVTSSLLKNADLLLYSSCIEREYPEVVEKQSMDKTALHVCLQERHMDPVGFKVATIIYKSHPRSITVLTMNGSPHCVQLHMAVEQAKQLTNYAGAVKHLVVERGVLIEVSSEAVKAARHLAMVEELLRLARRS